MANETARQLRKRLTPQEVRLWAKLRVLKQLGFHFRRQVPIGAYIVDFACFNERIAIEVDGGQHGFVKNAERDRDRDAFLASQGFRILRFWNSDIDQNLDGVMERILTALQTPTPTG
ncbi:MAG: endonuclease domain-containing protein [Afipia sp.]|jgi:very-short-patch-repair endonuclease|nr:endonuclease domain-containing protein [Afipia sp.]MBS4003949.1 endonuclease domain-containing protein [Afipia sp.]